MGMGHSASGEKNIDKCGEPDDGNFLANGIRQKIDGRQRRVQSERHREHL
jgi:hypothetical protein